MKHYTIRHAGHCAFTGRAMHDRAVIEVPFAERHQHAPHKYRCGYIAPDGAHVAICERAMPASTGRCDRCR